MTCQNTLLAALLCLVTAGVCAGPEDFHPGSLIKNYGPIASVPGASTLPSGTEIKLAVDISEGGERGQINPAFENAASLLNLWHAAGIPRDKTQLALVVHGSAYRDLLTGAAYGGSNPNAELIALLQAQGVRIYYCGQSAVYHDVGAQDLLPGIDISLSATTTHALLQHEGFAIKPF
jgi:intracellular sulfur oxidation DsrE/DsrF family protein